MLHRVTDDYWHVVAGVVEDGESFAEAAARELREETGLDAPVSALHMTQRYAISDALRSQYVPDVNEVIIENFTVDAEPGWEPVLNEEHDGYRWLDAADAAAIAYWPETRDLIFSLAARPDAPR